MFENIAGLRSAEAVRLGEHREYRRFIDLERGVIHISPEVSKTREYRQVTIHPPLEAFLTAYPGKEMVFRFQLR